MNISKIIEKVTNKEPLFTMMIAELAPEEKKDIQTACTDGDKIYYNPKFMEKLTEDEQSAVILHETLHCTFSHLWRKKDRDDLAWNVSCDYAINGIVNEIFPLPHGSLNDSKYYGLSAEAIYDLLPKKKSLKPQSWGEHNKWPQGNKKKKGGGSGKEKQNKKGIMGQFSEAIKRAMGEMNKDKKAQDSRKQRQLAEKWDNLFKEAILKNYGKMPDSIKRVIEKSYYVPVIDWSSLVTNLLSEDVNDYTFASPDRRFMDEEFVLPGTESIDRLKDVVFAFDTSGSINNEMLMAFYLEAMNIFNNFSSLSGWVAICDAQLHHFKEIDQDSTFSQFDFTGGGGTSFRPVFDEIKRRALRPKGVFYFTDTEGDFPDEKPPYPVFWLKMSRVGDLYVPSVPFGTVVKFLPSKL